MGFTSFNFWLFAAITLLIYGIAPKKSRWWILLAASYSFYAFWRWEYLGLLMLVTGVSYITSRQMAAAARNSTRKLWLVLGLGFTLGNLFLFKYFDYTLGVLRAFISSSVEISFLDVAAPLGISFFTLQVTAYLVDVYHNQQPASERSGRYALAVAFFPQLIAGPITRVQKLLPQWEELNSPSEENFTPGLFRMLWGAVQKFVIADRLAALIDPMFEQSGDYSGATLTLGLFLFAIQIYLDFAGYSNLAIGLARLFGVRLAENFRQPYLALDAGDFWNRWHISLSNWLRDYIFYPVMRWLRGFIHKPGNLLLVTIPPLVTMLVSGIWHGTGTHFLFWGLIHGVLLALAAGTSRWRKDFSLKLGKIGHYLFDFGQWLLTFSAVTLAWVFFRLPTIGSGIVYLSGMLNWRPGWTELPIETLITILILVVLFFLMELVRTRLVDFESVKTIPLASRWALSFVLIFLLLFMGAFEASQPFIYQQF